MNRDRPQHLSARADDHLIADCWVALAGFQRRAAQSDAMIQRDVFANLGGLSDHRPRPVVDKAAPADGRTGVNLDIGQKAPQMGNDARQGDPAMPPYRISQTVEDDCMEPGIAQDDLEFRSRRRVALHDSGDTLAHIGKKTCHPLVPNSKAPNSWRLFLPDSGPCQEPLSVRPRPGHIGAAMRTRCYIAFLKS